MNIALRNAVNNPVEHIRWLYGNAPEGKYEVYVHHYHQHITSTEETYFALEMKIGDQLQQLKGSVMYDDSPKLIHTFTYTRDAAAIELANQIRSERRSTQMFMTLMVGFWTGVLALGISFGLVILLLGHKESLPYCSTHCSTSLTSSSIQPIILSPLSSLIPTFISC